jgi:hypothetical protein
MPDSVVRNTALTLSSERAAAYVERLCHAARHAASRSSRPVFGALRSMQCAGDRRPIIAVGDRSSSLFVLCGFYMQQPNQATAITLFGDRTRAPTAPPACAGCCRGSAARRCRSAPTTSSPTRIKVNDLRGNPIEMAAQVVWRVTDTAQALFDVDDYKAFVIVQIEAAVRTIGARYPYDDFEHQEVTLRGNHDQVGASCAGADRAAGRRRHHRRRMRLHPPRLCAGDRRRDAAPAAGPGGRRGAQDLVEGAVGMVEMALEMLSEKNVVELDDERRAAMVSNLMVVLCGERDTQPVVNTGSLYQ